jgi:small subunit ribosomal protein S17
MKKQQKTIGIEVPFPKEKCEDKNCPFHGELKVRGRIFKGEIVSKDTHKSAKITWERQRYLPKYERYEKRLSKISVHNPRCIDAQVGDTVEVMETRPTSKTKHFVIIQILKNETNIS